MDLGQQVELNPYFKVVETVIPFTGTGTRQIAANDPSRVALIVSNNSTATVVLGTVGSNLTTAGVGIQLAQNAVPFVVLFSQTGSYCQQAWFANSASPSWALYVTTISTLPVER